ncbi:NAD-binding protein [Sulfurimonas sp. SAG-AH-194-I05]|nr:NAD-binding protein [Sulfurimonas sp. SAG-AH-194-I05]MDF1875151.1 NAD-binding protein [Sulfurimonas sp. SAG-AH-194-I05]
MNESSLWIILQRMRLPFVVILITYTIAMIGLILIPGQDLDGNVYHMSIFDAFYFVTYTATTIGFGEFPYPFTYHQKIWVSMSIYTSVLGWFYGIGALVTLFQDKLFLSEIAIASFQRSVKNIKEDFVIVLGYNETTSEIIKRMLAAKVRVVVIEKDQLRADYLRLEGYVPPVPILIQDAHNPKALEDAGIKSPSCKGVISLFKSEVLNLRITLASKLLNPHVQIVVKSTTDEETLNLLQAGANIVDNPFLIISYQLQMALKAPSILKLENWLYQSDTLESKTFSIPNEDIVICGYGRLGSYIYDMFLNNGILATVIEIDKAKVNSALYQGKENIIHGNADDQVYLDKANIQDAKLIIIATDDDTTNLSILSTVKKLNSNALIVARENDITDFSIFSHAKIDHLYLPEQILIHKTTNALSNPLSDKLIRCMVNKDEQWGQSLLANLMRSISVNPITFELNITEKDSYEIFKYLKKEDSYLTVGMLKGSRRDREQKNNIIPLLIQREEEEILLPEDDFQVLTKDKILFACDENAREDLESIANNAFEFNYIMTGKEKGLFFL